MKEDNWPQVIPIFRNGKQIWFVNARIMEDRKFIGERRTFKLKKEAEGWAEQVRIRRKREGTSSLGDQELANYGWSVSRAVRFALKHLRKKDESISVAAAVQDLIETKRGAGRSRRYCNDLKLRLGRLSAAFSDKTMAEITTADLNAFLANLKVAAGTWNTFGRDIRTLWSFADKHKWAESNIAKNIERAKGNADVPRIITPVEAAALLVASSWDSELLAFHAIGIFAGLRVCELKVIEWGRHVNLAKGFIELDASITKTKQRRLVPILPCLRAWLQLIAKPTGKVITRDLRKPHYVARDKAGIEWQEHIMRHSFASYRLADVQNAPQVALETGHSVAILYKHYRELVMPEDAKCYFGIFPSDAAAEKILPMSGAA